MIIGAGFAGLIAAYVLPKLQAFEANAAPELRHRALLRFRSDSVSKLTGIEFRPVTVRKGIFIDGKFVPPSIQLANMYSNKCLGKIIGQRSIWNLDAVTRFIAPEDIYHQMLDAVGDRAMFNACIDFKDIGTKEIPFAINTAPMPAVLDALAVPCKETFLRRPIHVARFRVQNCDAHQTVYFPSDEYNLYRASITGDLLIAEFATSNGCLPYLGEWPVALQEAFKFSCADRIDQTSQRYGKIAPIDNAVRKQLIYSLTQRHGIFSLGRFAVWRNILLDDVVEDAAIVKRLLSASSYERRLMSL